jgi:hypothetical protein
MINLSNNKLTNINNIELLNKINENNENKIINLSHNNITTIDCSLLKENYQVIHLSYNEISGINLTNEKREKIHLAHNKISDIVINNLNCKHLDISNNIIRNIIFIDCIIDFLDLSTNCIESIKFINTKVKELDLSINKLKFLDSYPNTIENIILFANKLIGIGDMPNTIKKMDISDNKLKELTCMSDNLITLDISKNLLTYFNVSIIPESLIYFDITENNIKDKGIFNCLTIPNLIIDSDSDSDSNSDSDINIELIPSQHKNNKTFVHQYINESNLLLENEKSSNSDFSTQLTRKNIQTINLSDDSEEWDDLDVQEDNNSTLLESDDESDSSDTSSDNELDLWKFTQKMNNKKVMEETNNNGEDFSDDEISRALQEYKENIKEKKTESVNKTHNNSNLESQDIIELLKDYSSDDSKSISYPIYVTYDLHFEIVI